MHAVVAASKLTIPVSRRPLVPRPELCERLDADYRVGLVSAPAGYGKTAILASWAEAHDGRVAWLSCDALDAEPTRFMSGLLAAIARQWPGAADDASVLLEREGANTYDPAVAVANDLTVMAETGVIVIDDLHLAEPSPVMLSAFIGALPEGFRLVVGTRSDPPLSLGRLRVRGELLELRGDDLRFGPEELSDFLRLHDVPMGGSELERLHELTEGWPAGAQLAAIALQRGAQRDDLLQALATTDRAVGDFLLSEVLASLPDELVEFLVRTSVLEAFDAELCAAVTGVEASAEVLRRLIAANLFVVPLDGRAHWYRYHHLFGSFLRARLALSGPTRVRTAHEEACRALEECGDVAGALREAMVLGDVDRAGRILRNALTRSLSVPKGAIEVIAQALRLWLHEFGAAHTGTDPEWVLEFVVGLIMVSGADDAPRWLESVRTAHPEADDRLIAMIEGAWGEHHLHHGQPQEALRRLTNALAAVGWNPPDHSLLPVLHTAMARAHLQAGDVDGARVVLSGVMDRPVGNAVADEVRNPAIAALVAARDGELGRADHLAASADRAADRLGLGIHDLGRVFAALARAEIHLEHNDDDDATAVLDDVHAVSEASRRLTLQGLVVLQQARLARVVGDEAQAVALLDRARLLYEDPDESVTRVLAEEAVAQALRFAPPTAAALIDALDRSRPATRLMRARLALLEHDDRLAASILANLPPPTSRRERVQRGVLCGLAMLRRDVERANGHLRDALAAGEPEWLVRTIVDLGPGVHDLLQSYAPDRSQQRYLERLLAVTGRVVAPARRREATTLVEALSERELTVLRYLCSRLTYQEIAAALYVSLNTLKSHVRSVYRKLGVASRADAVDCGRRLGLI